MKATKYVRDWLERGNDDLSAAKILLKENVSPNTVCFHAQQAAEKYLKGFLAHHRKHVRKVHDLDALLEVCIKVNPVINVLKEEARFLNQFYVESRYPDEYIKFSRADAEQTYKAALRIRDAVLKKLG